MGFSSKSAGAALIPVLALAGCVSGDPNRNHTRDGAIVGGILGGVLGAANSDNELAGGALGAAAGAIAGGAIGASLDRQARDLRSAIDDERILIENTGQELVVRMPEGILFDIDSAALRPDLTPDLRALARNLRQYSDTGVNVLGHTDNTGSAIHNQDLSARRAGAVSRVLLAEGVRPDRVRSFGRGEAEPIATNLTPEGRQANRRVEVVIRPMS